MSCPDCVKGNILPGTPTGEITKSYGNCDAYHAPRPSGGTSTRAVVILTDVFGLPMTNHGIVADRYAKELDCDVWVPDFFNGSPPVKPSELQTPQIPGDKMSFMAKLRLVWLIIRRLPQFIFNRPSVVDARVELFMRDLQAEKKYTSVGAIGYCWGGGMLSRLGGKDNLFSSLVIAHPAPPALKDIEAIKVPTAWSVAEEDSSFPPKLRDQAEAIFAARAGKPNFIDYEFKQFPGTVHGFAVRPNLAYEPSMKGYEGAFKQGVEWFNKTLK